LYPVVDAAFQESPAGYYRDGIEWTMERGTTNPSTSAFIWVLELLDERLDQATGNGRADVLQPRHRCKRLRHVLYLW
jgi:hypothetical protein